MTEENIMHAIIEGVVKIIKLDAPSILADLEITAEEWDYADRIKLSWEGPEGVVGRTIWPENEVPSLANTTVLLFIENAKKYGHYDSFVHRILSTLAHELKHVQQIKLGFAMDIDYKKMSEVGYADYMGQAIEQEAREYAVQFMAPIIKEDEDTKKR